MDEMTERTIGIIAEEIYRLNKTMEQIAEELTNIRQLLAMAIKKVRETLDEEVEE